MADTEMDVDPPAVASKGKKESKEAKPRFEVKKVSAGLVVRFDWPLTGSCFKVERSLVVGLG